MIVAGTSPLPHPATHRILSSGGWMGEWAGTAPKDSTWD